MFRKLKKAMRDAGLGAEASTEEAIRTFDRWVAQRAGEPSVAVRGRHPFVALSMPGQHAIHGLQTGGRVRARQLDASDPFSPQALYVTAQYNRILFRSPVPTS